MCAMAKERMISCQISYFPIDSNDYLGEVDQVLELIKKSDLEYNVDVLSTTIKGGAQKIFKLLSMIDQEMSDHHYHYTMSILISNTCGCELA